MRPESSQTCHVCGGVLEALACRGVESLITSDCRIWPSRLRLSACATCGVVQKPVDPAWREEAARIYAGYAVYAQGDGNEQPVFSAESGSFTSRSRRIVAWIGGRQALPAAGALCDIGCGNGGFLQAFGSANPGWRMVGVELDDRNRARVEAIRGVERLHVGPVEQLQERFDLIAMIHALEHIPDPIAFLRGLKELLKPGGALLVEVPDLEFSPFDILIADHCTHFSGRSLRWVLDAAGYDVKALDNACVAKELTLFAAPRPGAAGNAAVREPAADAAVAGRHLAWLRRLLDQAHGAPETTGIFGTSISGTWLAAALGARARFFVDEDPGRIGHSHLGLPILRIADAPKDSSILMPIRRDIAVAIAARLGAVHPGLVLPPED